MAAGVSSRSSPGGWCRARCGSRASSTSTAPIVGYQGGLIREMPDAGRDAARAAADPHADPRRRRPRGRRSGRGEHGLDPHLNHLERFILRADDPNAERLQRVHGRPGRAGAGPRRRRSATPSPRSSRSASRRCPTELAPLARAHFAGRAEVTISHPRFLEFVAPGVSKGRAVRWLARRLRRAARGDARHRRPVERHRDARRGRARRRDADRARRRSRPSRGTSPRRSRRRASPR